MLPIFFFIYLATVVAGASLVAPRTAVTTNTCSCSSGQIGVDVDVNIAVDPSNGKLLNSTTLRRQKQTFQIFGQLCQPVDSLNLPAPVQVLIHGQTYTSQYWNVQWNGFQNYSYVDFSCSQGVTSFVYDNICAGLSSHPATSKDCQLPTAAAVASSVARKLKDGSVAKALTGTTRLFTKVVGIGHSLGSLTLNFAAVQDGISSPFAGLILTSNVHIANSTSFLAGLATSFPPAASVNPARWGNLDPGYISGPSEESRLIFYGTPDTFNPSIPQLDFLTEDVGSIWILDQIANINTPVAFRGPITTILGALDGTLCIPCDQPTLQAREKVFFPNADFNLEIIPKVGHDIDLHFGAANVFPMMLDLFNAATK
ncbi:hypothetical protein M422DRAFT_260412 [Sphaerobolus stellatus SS14]|uniref:AB hydrolase-1 domain-containing protein n=1 Tax=Sphaerobolus stellatus (strain SS14) TaxID=990650 RepID=A0A0C9UH41_SPHS4|nr:hypothetical protein M422DRAFT_274392 [Sphaerobolus stellatus SS14]KIJ37029.1 hypothetical protein M422DRAFT_260412 [Sphaerobolus stellatus SS14]